MIRLVASLLLASFFMLPPADACTTFSFSGKEGRVFGKVFDWNYSHGMLTVNKRNVNKRSLKLKPTDKELVWTSTYGSVTFNQHGREFPLGGMNEAGLVIEVMVGKAEHISGSDPRPSVNEVQWIQHALDRYAKTADLIAEADKIRVSQIKQNVHYLVCDISNDCATVEYLNGKLVRHFESTLMAPAFSNSTYDDSAKHLQNFAGFGGRRPIPTDRSSLSRFVIAAAATRDGPAAVPSVDFTFNTMAKVEDSGVWKNIYIGDHTIITKNKQSSTTKVIDLKKFEFNCAKPVKILNVAANVNGEANSHFEDYSFESNQRLINQDQSVPANVRALAAKFPETHTQCMDL